MAVTHRTIGVAVETLFGSLSTSTNLPDFSGINYKSIPCEMDPILIYGEPLASERNDAKDGSYFLPPEPDTVYMHPDCQPAPEPNAWQTEAHPHRWFLPPVQQT